jgi:hypothetical protein
MRYVMRFVGVLIMLLANRCLSAPVLDQSHIITQSVGGLITVGDFTPGQTFTVGAAGLLSQIDLQIGRDAGALDNLSLEIWPTSSGSPTGSSPLFSASIPASSVPVAGPSTTLPFTSVNLASGNLAVAPGQTYAAVLRGVPDFDEPHAFWNWGNPGYSLGTPVSTAFGHPWEVESSQYDFGFRTWVTPPPGPPGPAYRLIETAKAKPIGNPFLAQSIDATYYQGVNIEVVRPTRLSSIGGYLYGGTGQIFGAVVKLNDRNAAPNPTNFSGSDVLATALINVPTGSAAKDVSAPIDVTLQPGFYGLWLGSGKFGATGTTDLIADNEEVGSWYTWSMSQPGGTRDFGNSQLRIFADASSDSGTVQLRPAADGEAELSGGSYLIRDDDENIDVEHSTSTGRDRRSVMEFSLANIPAHAVVQSASLQFDVSGLQSNGTSFPRLQVHGYAGNGQITAADATVPTNLIGTSPNVTSSSDLVTVNLNPAYIQSLLGTANYLGLLGKADVNNLSVSLRPNETGGFGEAPLLTISLSVPGDYNGDIRVDAADYELWRSGFGSSSSLKADGNKNGVIDAADYVIWRNLRSQNGAGSGDLTPAVPEPSRFFLVAFALSGLMGYPNRLQSRAG